MDRRQFRATFAQGSVAVFPVVHVIDTKQAERNVATALDAGCPGVFLINHDFDVDTFLPIVRATRAEFQDAWIGVNFLAVTGEHAFPILAYLEAEGTPIDAYWADDARIDERRAVDDQVDAARIAKAREASGWKGLYFGGTAFKKQRPVEPIAYATSATLARAHMDVVTTSGIATGREADMSKIETFREACADVPLALASGITPENVAAYARHVDAVLVATGINREGDFYNIDRSRLDALLANIEGNRT